MISTRRNMGYELVKLNDEAEPFDVINWDDTNYFRLNTENIGRARMLALWGAGVILNTDMLNYTMVSAGLLASNPTVEEAHAVHKLSEELSVPWLEPFTSNNKKKVHKSHCLQFAGNLKIALNMIKDSPVQPDYELQGMDDFVEFLLSCPNGVWLE